MKVLVTGANGHLGYNLVKELLKTGYAVRGSIRSLNDTQNVQRLKSLGDVEIVEANLDRPDQLTAAMKGKSWNFSNQRIKDILGWQPKFSLEQSLRDTIDEIKKLKRQD